MRSDIVTGGAFPDFSLPDQTGTVGTLSELQGRDPLILTLARGNYCPKEHQQHLVRRVVSCFTVVDGTMGYAESSCGRPGAA